MLSFFKNYRKYPCFYNPNNYDPNNYPGNVKHRLDGNKNTTDALNNFTSVQCSPNSPPNNCKDTYNFGLHCYNHELNAVPAHGHGHGHLPDPDEFLNLKNYRNCNFGHEQMYNDLHILKMEEHDRIVEFLHNNKLEKNHSTRPCNFVHNNLIGKNNKGRKSGQRGNTRRYSIHRNPIRHFFQNRKGHINRHFNSYYPYNIYLQSPKDHLPVPPFPNDNFNNNFNHNYCNSDSNRRPTGVAMGQTLSEPVTQKETSRCEDSRMRVGASCMQGWRVNMEDAHTTILSLPDDPRTAFFAVYDGHGGARIAQYAGKHLHKMIIKRPEYNSGDIESSIKMGYLDIDYAMQHDDILKDELAGTTAVCCLLRDNKIYCGNVGDSRAVASISGVARELSNDHKPSLASEQRRITAAGGWVELNRVNGNLALSRALGDFVFKKNEQKGPQEQIVTAWPDVTVHEIDLDWEFIILACDGIWDVMTSQEVVDFVRLRLSEGKEPEDICEDLMRRCLAPDGQMGGLGCDNMTVVLVCFVHGSWRQLQEQCSLITSNLYIDSNDSEDMISSSEE